jgi:hypothetical protein
MRKISISMVFLMALAVVYFQKNHNVNVDEPVIASSSHQLEWIWQRLDRRVVITFKGDGRIIRDIDGTCGPRTKVFDSTIDPNAVVADGSKLIWYANQTCGSGTTIDDLSSGTLERM